MDRLDESEKTKIRRGIVAGFDRHSQRYYENFFKALGSGSNEDRRKAYEKAFLEQSFLVKRTISPGFDRHVLNHVRASPAIRRQRHTILKGCLTPILRPEGLYIYEVVSRSDGPSYGGNTRGFTRRHVQRLFHQYYSETFFQNEEEMAQPLDDQRFTPFQSIFSTNELPRSSTSELAADYYAQDYASLLKQPQTLQRTMLSAWIRLVTPEFIESLLGFRTECAEIAKGIKGSGERSDFFLDEISSFSSTLLVLHANFNSILALEWFRIQRDVTRRSLLSHNSQLHYSLRDGAEARKLLMTLVADPEKVRKLLEEGSLAFSALGMRGASVLLMNQCLKLEGLLPLALGVSCENVAVLCREQGKFKLMVQLMKRALNYYREAGEKYRVCVALKNLGEAEWKLGFKQASLQYFESAERLGAELPQQEQRFAVYHNLSAAANRIGEKKMEIGYLEKCLKTLPEDAVNKLFEIEQRLDELLR